MPRRAETRLVVVKAEVARMKEKVFETEQGMKNAYLDEVEQREGKERWNFVREFNQLLSGETNKIATLGAIQKDLVDCWREQDFEGMQVTREQVLKELEYEEVLVPLEIQYTNIERRKQRSRQKVELFWGRDWKRKLGSMNPNWESEHYLQHLSVLAKEFSDLDFVLPFLGSTMDRREFQSRVKKVKMLTPQDVKLTLAELTRYRERKQAEGMRLREREEREEEEEEEEQEEEEEEEEDQGEEEGEQRKGKEKGKRKGRGKGKGKRKGQSAKRTLPTRPNKRLRSETRHISLEPLDTDVMDMEERRTTVKENWPATTDQDLDAVESAVLSLISQGRERLPFERVIDRLHLLQRYLQLQVIPVTDEEWEGWGR